MYYLVEGGEGRAERRMGMNLSLHYSPAHRWSYFPVPAHDATLGPPRLKRGQCTRRTDVSSEAGLCLITAVLEKTARNAATHVPA